MGGSGGGDIMKGKKLCFNHFKEWVGKTLKSKMLKNVSTIFPQRNPKVKCDKCSHQAVMRVDFG